MSAWEEILEIFEQLDDGRRQQLLDIIEHLLAEQRAELRNAS
jgi:hypothetical protein